MTIGEKILNLRKARGWSQEELAEQIGVSRQAVSRWESDSAKPDADKIITLCSLFEISADYLLGIAEETEQRMPECADAVKREDRHSGGENRNSFQRAVSDRKIVSWLLVPVTALLLIGYFIMRESLRRNLLWLFWLSLVGLIIGLLIGPWAKRAAKNRLGRKIGWLLLYISIGPFVAFVGYFGLFGGDWEWEIIYPTLAALGLGCWLVFDSGGKEQ